MIVALAAYLVVSLVAVLGSGRGDFAARTMDLTVGMVVPEDIIAQRDVSYTDEKATELKREARLSLVQTGSRPIRHSLKRSLVSSAFLESMLTKIPSHDTVSITY